MMSEEPNAEISYTDDVSLPWSGQCFWLVMLWGKLASTDQKYDPDLGRNMSSYGISMLISQSSLFDLVDQTKDF